MVVMVVPGCVDMVSEIRDDSPGRYNIPEPTPPPPPPHPLPPRLLAASWTKVHIALALNPKSSKGAIEPQETVY